MKVKHKGYVCKTHGNSKMSIYKDGKEVMHTYSRNENFCRTEDDLKTQIDTYLELMSIL